MRAVFRVDSGQDIGSGHLTRCIALAEKLSGDITFVCGDQSLPTPYPTIYISSLSITELPYSDVLIIDHYKLGYDYEVAVRHTTKLLVVIDDLHRKHECDVIIDPVKRSYADRTPVHTVNLTGLDYILLSSAITSTPPKSFLSSFLKRIVVSFGGADPENMTKQILSKLTGYDIDVVLGASYSHSIEPVAPNVQLHRNLTQSQFAQLLTRGDLAIGGGGVSMYERMFLHVPSVVIPIVDNQLPGVLALDTDWVKSYKDTNITLELIVPKTVPPVDGLGAKRISVVINHLLESRLTD